MSSFFQELKRRKVYRVAVGYLVAGWLIIQVAATIFPILGLPDGLERVVVTLLLIGFPLALCFAWAFDLTPQGIQATRSLPSASASPSRHRGRNIGLLIGSGILVSGIASFFLLPRAAATKTEKSIAVLPFENFSDKPENAHFADGIQDDILTSLSKIGDLKVISRTSVMAYRGKQKSVRQIGKELGVGAILEGSVRREGSRVRVNVQLINAINDHHIWAEDYDRELTDVFAIQTDLAQSIARELRAQLSPSEKAEITRKPTENAEAYLAFVEAHALQHSVEDHPKLQRAVELYERAIELDPNFVEAIASLSITHSWLFHTFEPTEKQRNLARQYADRALALARNSPEAHLARGFCYYYGERDFNAALREFDLAKEGLPNDDEVYLVIGAIQRRQDKWKESTANLEKAVALNPNSSWPLQNLFFNYQMQRQFDAAAKTVDRALAIDPKSFGLWGLKSKLALAARGDMSVADEAIAKFVNSAKKDEQWKKEFPAELLTELTLGEAGLRMLQRRFDLVLKVLKELPEKQNPSKPHGIITALTMEGFAYEQLGQAEVARESFLKARQLAEAAVAEEPNDASRHAMLAQVLARLGERDAAIAEGLKAVELLPISVDAFEGPQIKTVLAEVYAITGENSKAIEVLDELLGRPSDLTVELIKLDPTYDGLRKDPGFQNLLAKYQSRG